MPIFEFACSDCGEEFEELMLGSKKAVSCPKCGSSRTQKQMSSFAFKAGYKFVGTGKKASSGCTGCTSSSCSSCGS
jgi:putative FmdB family regulatory protein